MELLTIKDILFRISIYKFELLSVDKYLSWRDNAINNCHLFVCFNRSEEEAFFGRGFVSDIQTHTHTHTHDNFYKIYPVNTRGSLIVC